jgi:hypothetical protein
VDMRLLFLSLETAERVCGQVRSETSVASCDKKPSHSNKYLHSDLVLPMVPESSYRETLRPCNKHGGAWRTHDSCNCRRFEKGEQKNPISAPLRKAERNPIPESSPLHVRARNRTSSRRCLRNKTPRSGNVAVAIAIPTTKQELDRGA